MVHLALTIALRKLRRLNLLIIFFCCQASANSVNSVETLGSLQFDRTQVESILLVEEPQRVNFDFRNTFIALRWDYQKWLSSVIAIGQEELLGVPSAYSGDGLGEDFTIVEGYGQAKTPLGILRLGLIPIGFGAQGADRESELLFSRSLFFQQRKMVLRDLGVSYEIGHNGFYTRMTVHNGEGGRELDNRSWFTANWSFRTNHWTFEGSASTGETTARSTNQAGDPSVDTVFDPTLGAEWRIGALSAQFVDRYLVALVEAFAARVDQDNGYNEFYSGHIDVYRHMDRHWSLGARYDVIELDRNQSGDRLSEFTLLGAWHNEYRTSRISVEVTKRIEPDSASDQVLFIWRLTPQGMAFSNRYR